MAAAALVALLALVRPPIPVEAGSATRAVAGWGGAVEASLFRSLDMRFDSARMRTLWDGGVETGWGLLVVIARKLSR